MQLSTVVKAQAPDRNTDCSASSTRCFCFCKLDGAGATRTDTWLDLANPIRVPPGRDSTSFMLSKEISPARTVAAPCSDGGLLLVLLNGFATGRQSDNAC